jgi:hypothetical protein
MWTCKKCGEKLEDQFNSCWKCSTPREQVEPASVEAPGGDTQRQWRLNYRIFRGTFATWEELFTKAAYFATEVGPEQVLNVSHSVDDGDGVVTVWYWGIDKENHEDPKQV